MSKMISESMVRLAQTVLLSCTDTNTISKEKEVRFHMTHVTYGTFDANHAPILPQVEHYLQTDRNELPLEPRHLVVPLGASKMISKPVVCLARTMHLYCTETNTVSKLKEARFQMTHVT